MINLSHQFESHPPPPCRLTGAAISSARDQANGHFFPGGGGGGGAGFGYVGRGLTLEPRV